MKMKTFKNIALAGLALMALSSCDKDGDMIYAVPNDAASIEGASAEVYLNVETPGALALTVYWNDNGDISTSNPAVAAPELATTNVLQLAADEEFTNTVDYNIEAGVYEKQITHSQLNNACSRLNMPTEQWCPLYVRVKSYLGVNVPPRYSNVLKVAVRPYFIDWTIAKVLNEDKSDSGKILYSAASDGVYCGFLGMGAWGHMWVKEGDGTTWGFVGVGGKPFQLSSDADAWNIWFPGQNGCYYVTFDTNNSDMTALLVNSLTLYGDLSGEMVYNRSLNVWTYALDGSKTGNVTVKISGQGALYTRNSIDADGNISDDATTPQAVTFGGSADMLTFGADSEITIALPAGESVLTLNLNDPRAMTLTAGGAPEPEPEPTPEADSFVYLPGVDDGWGVDWNFNNYLICYDSAASAFGGAVNFNSKWGYQVCTIKDDWGSALFFAEGDAAAGKLTTEGNTNLPAPGIGMYVVECNLSEMTYATHAITAVGYAGLNDDWTITPMAETSTPGVYTATVQKTANTPWGVKIIINNDWNIFFGGGNTAGTLYYQHDGFTGDNNLANGTYTLTVDLCKGTYSYQAN